MKTILVDIDNTLADQTEREQKATVNGKLDWDIFENPELVYKDKLILQTKQVLAGFHCLASESYIEPFKTIIVTARKEKLREVTDKWLFENYIGYDELLMRLDNDFRPDVEFKEELYERELKHLDIFCVFDDRPKVIRMWKSKGLYVFECNNKKGDW